MIPADDPTADAGARAAAHAEDVEYSLDHWGDRFVVLTNLDAPDFRVMTAPLDAPGRVDRAAPPRARSPLHVGRAVRRPPRAARVERRPAQGAGAVPGRPRGRARLRRRAPRPRARRQPGVGHDVAAPVVPVADDAGVGVRRRRRHRRAHAAQADADARRRPRAATCRRARGRRRRTARAVPVDVVRHVDTPLDGTAPAVVYGYGSYEASMPPWFSVARLSLLDRGVRVGARAPARRRRARPAAGTSTASCCTSATRSPTRWPPSSTSSPRAWPTRHASRIRGGSAGGLLVGACITMRPELFASAVAEVPFVDVVTTMSDATLPLTANEWEEWGDPRVEPFASYMLTLLAVRQHRRRPTYPALYVTAGLNDPRVSYHEPAKWVARLRAVGAGRDRLLAAAHRDGRRPRRPERPLRRLARRGPHPRRSSSRPSDRFCPRDRPSGRSARTTRRSGEAGDDGDDDQAGVAHQVALARAGGSTTPRSTRTAGAGRRRAGGR